MNRRFCRVPFGEAVPHPSTLEKTTSRCGKAAVAELNEVFLAKAQEHHLVKLSKLRADTAVVPANIEHPSNSGLLAKGASRAVVLMKRLQSMGLAARTKVRDRRRCLAARGHAIGTWLRRRTEEAKDEVLAITSKMAEIAGAVLADAARVAQSSARSLRRRGKAVPARAKARLEELADVAATVAKVAEQARQRAAGAMPEGAEGVVSFHDKDARPIRKGRIGKPAEFGYKAQFVDNADSLVLDPARPRS